MQRRPSVRGFSELVSGQLLLWCEWERRPAETDPKSVGTTSKRNVSSSGRNRNLRKVPARGALTCFTWLYWNIITSTHFTSWRLHFYLLSVPEEMNRVWLTAHKSLWLPFFPKSKFFLFIFYGLYVYYSMYQRRFGAYLRPGRSGDLEEYSWGERAWQEILKSGRNNCSDTAKFNQPR